MSTEGHAADVTPEDYGTGPGTDNEGVVAQLFQINQWCAKCWPENRSQKSQPLDACIAAGHTFDESEPKVTTILWPPVPGGVPQTYVVVRPPPSDFDFSHMQYLPCGYGRDCKFGRKCTRAHSNPPQAEIAYWNFLQPLGPPSRRRRAANEKRATTKDWTSAMVYECHICGVRMNSKAQRIQHESGNKHRAQVAASQGLARAANIKPTGRPNNGASSDVEHSALPHGTGPYYSTQATGWASVDDGGQVAVSDSAIGYDHSDVRELLQARLDPLCPPIVKSLRVAELDIPDMSESSQDEAGLESRTMGQRGPRQPKTSRNHYAVVQSYLTAVKDGDTAQVADMIRQDKTLVDTREAGCPALQWAIFMCKVDAALLIIQAGAQRNLVDQDKQTAIHICLHPRHGMMKYVLKAKAADGSDTATAKKFKRCETDTIRVLTALLEAGWSPDNRDARGRTGLHHVAEQGNVNFASVLLKYNANPKILNKEGWSPTDVATLKAKTEGLPKFVQLRDLMLNASFSSGTAESPMSIPAEGYESPPIHQMAASAAKPQTALTTGGGPARASMSKIDAMSMPKPLANSGSSVDFDQYTDVDQVFRPLMAALCSFSGNWEHYAEHGVELSQLAVRLRPVIETIGAGGLKCKTYVTHARDRGLVVIRQSVNKKQHYVSIAPKYSHLLAQPSQQFTASDPYFDKVSNGAWSTPDYVALKQLPLSKASLQSANLLHSAEPGEPAEPTLIESDFSASGHGQPFEFEAMLNGMMGQDDDQIGPPEKGGIAGEPTLLTQISDSFHSDPFSDGAQGAQYQEPLFPTQQMPPGIGGVSIDPWASTPASHPAGTIGKANSWSPRSFSARGTQPSQPLHRDDRSATVAGLAGLQMDPSHFGTNLAWASADASSDGKVTPTNTNEPDPTLS